jgi:hypothetical protein
MVDAFFKYNSSSKEYVNLGAKSFSVITDAVSLKKTAKSTKNIY